MRRIHKGWEPKSLPDHRREGGTYETYDQRDDVRKTLLQEQGSICCYCMKSIALRNMRIEHWDSQTDFPHRTVDYDNLLGACTGGENTLPPAQQHCDTARGETPLHIHPARHPPSCEQLIHYSQMGEVGSADATIHNDLVAVLKLNTDVLKKARVRVMDQLMSELLREKKNDFWSPELLLGALARWRSRDKTGAHREFCQVVIYCLEKRLEKLKKKA